MGSCPEGSYFRGSPRSSRQPCPPTGHERPRLTPAASRCRILVASARPRPRCSHTGQVLTSFSRTLMPRRGRQFFGVTGRRGPTPSSSSSCCPSPLPTSGIGLRTESNDQPVLPPSPERGLQQTGFPSTMLIYSAST